MVRFTKPKNELENHKNDINDEITNRVYCVCPIGKCIDCVCVNANLKCHPNCHSNAQNNINFNCQNK